MCLGKDLPAPYADLPPPVSASLGTMAGFVACVQEATSVSGKHSTPNLSGGASTWQVCMTSAAKHILSATCLVIEHACT